MPGLHFGIHIPRQSLPLGQISFPLGVYAKYPRSDSHHITLKYVGLHKEKTYEILHVVEEAIQSWKNETNFKIDPENPIRISGIGAFPESSYARTVYLGVVDPEINDNGQGLLYTLNKIIEESLERIGIPKSRYEYNPHVTIAESQMKDLRAFFNRIWFKPVKIVPDVIKLFESVSGRHEVRGTINL